jgi:LAS superfamily LD-carboxypeptidase LdcB
MKLPLTKLLCSLLATFIFLSAQSLRAGESFPQPWILLTARPALWQSPGGKKSSERLSIGVGAEVSVEERIADPMTESTWLRVRHNHLAGWLPEALLAPRPQAISPDKLAQVGEELVDRYHGISAEYEPRDLVEISGGYEKDRVYQLRREAAEAYERLRTAARREGIKLQVVSAYRSYATQRTVYLNKLERSGWNQTTVAKPGHSEHQLGTAVDFTDGDEESMLRESFGECRAGIWLRENAPKFGYAVSYTEANREKTGYSPEPWHYRYYGPELAPLHHASALGGK